MKLNYKVTKWRIDFLIFIRMIISIVPSIITEPKFIDAEILADETSVDADARLVTMKVIEFAMLTMDEEPEDIRFAEIQTKLIAAGFLCSFFNLREPIKLRIMMTSELKSDFVSGPSKIIDILDAKVKIDGALNDKIQKFIKSRVPTSSLPEN